MLIDYNRKRKQQYDKYASQKEEEAKTSPLRHLDTLDKALEEMLVKILLDESFAKI